MHVSDLRIALFSGNYNYVRDGANMAQNRLVRTLLDKGAQVRVYAPEVAEPAFPPTGPMVNIPSVALPGRAEYRVPTGMGRKAREDLEAFNPHIVHVSSPDRAARQAAKWAKKRNLPLIATVHTRFETYPQYYGLGFTEPWIEAWLRRLYSTCDALLVPSPTMVPVLLEQRMNTRVEIWSRGVDKTIFHPGARDLEWRRAIGLDDNRPVVGFLGRLVLEKGLDVFANALTELRGRGVDHQVMVIGEGPARDWFAERTPGAVFTGFQSGANLGRAVASMDMLFNPSITETFGNVTLEAMACGIPTVAARATGSSGLVEDGISGKLVEPGNIPAFADALRFYCESPENIAAHGAAAADKAKAYDWEAINMAVADVYLRLIAERAR